MNAKPKMLFKTSIEFEQWLSENYCKSKGIMMIRYKQSHPDYASCISYDEAIHIALSYGWIDSVCKKLDLHSYVLCFTPRKPKSVWSAINKRRINTLLEQKAMKAPGLEAIEIAKQNGSWTSLDDAENLVLPKDVEKVLQREGLLEKYHQVAMSKRKNFLYRYGSSKREETKQRRLEELMEELR
jgi:uncharacterized protein YdeI (YjbR/CyaY-like superfamily)